MKNRLEISSYRIYHALLKEFHPTLNGNINLTDFSPGSHKKVWWQCNIAEDHIWEAAISDRINGNKCPCCSGHKVVLSNCLYTKFPEISKQWHPFKNGLLTPLNVVAHSHKKVWWKCNIGNDHEWESTINNRVNGNKCPCCARQKTVLSNCLATTHPEVAKQWHPVKNLNLTPYDVSAKTNKKVWWKCNKADDHEWKTLISNKTRDNCQLGCPYCSGHQIVLSTCLATTHPEISKQWHPTKNIYLTPFKVSFGSNKKVWWKCNVNVSHEWIAIPNTMVQSGNLGNNGCPFCLQSGGEKIIKDILCSMNIKYEIQKKFDNCKYIRKLPFDFYIPEYNALIEYDGRHHYLLVEFFGGIKNLKQTKQRDQIKNDFANKNNMPLLRIPYTNFNSIENEIKYFIQSNKPQGVINSYI